MVRFLSTDTKMEGLCDKCRDHQDLSRAAMSCSKICLEILLKKGTSAKKISKVFVLAVKCDQFVNAHILLDAGIDISYKGIVQGVNLILSSAEKEICSRFIKKLVMAAATVTDLETMGIHGLHRSKEKDCTDVLINEEADVNLADSKGYTLLHFMAYCGIVDCSLSLISAGADVNKRSKTGETPLIRAARAGKVQVTELLLENGAEVNVCDSRGWCALFTAAWTGSAEILQLLCNAGADLNAKKTMMKQYILIAAASKGHEECVRLLLQKGADVNKSDDEGHTALVCAAHHGYIECVKLLLEAGADVNFICNSGTALSMTTMGPRPRLLKEYKFSHKSSKLPFTAAAGVNILIQSGADVNAVNSDNKTPLMLAALSNYTDYAKLLLRAGAEVKIMMNICFNILPVYVVSHLLREKPKIDTGMIALLYAAGETKEGVYSLLVDVLRHLQLIRETTEDVSEEDIAEMMCGLLHSRHHGISNKDCMRLSLQYLSDGDSTLRLKTICRQSIREYLLQMSRINLLVRIPHLGLPHSLVRYLLYDVSLDSP